MSIRGRIASWLLGDVAQLEEKPERLVFDERLSWDGQDYTSGEYDDHNADLANYGDRVEQYDRMRVGHASVVSQFEALLEPILSAKWEVERGPGLPLELGGEEDERTSESAAELIRANLLRDSALTEYRMRTPWKQFLGELFTAQEFGFSVFEKVHRMSDGPLGSFACYDRLAWVHPKSIKYLHVGEDGEFLGVTQAWTGGGYYDDELNWHTRSTERAGRDKWDGTFIPAERLFIHTRRKEGDNVEGRPMSRGMFGAYKRLSFFERAEVIDAQKRAIGIPFYRMAKDTPKENVAHAVKQVKGMRAGNERSFVVVQGEDEVGFVDMQANVASLDGYIRQASNAIRAVAGTEFKGLGQDNQGGSMALGEVQSKHFALHLEAIADAMRESVQLHLIEPIHAVNFAGITPPRLRVEDVAPPDLAPIVQAKSADLLGPWRGVDAQSVRKRLNLAELSEEEVARMDEMAEAMRDRLMGADSRPLAPGEEPDEPVPSDPEDLEPEDADDKAPDEPVDEEKDPPAEMGELDPRAEPVFGREPTRFERRVVALEEVNTALHRAEVGLAAELRTQRDAMIDDAIRRTTTVNGQPVVRGRLKRAALHAAVTRAAEAMQERGADDMRDEVLRQLRDLLGEDAALPAELGESARHADETLGRVLREVGDSLEARVKGDVIAEVIRGVESGASFEESLEIARTAAKTRSAATLATMARGVTGRAYNAGRIDAAEDVSAVVVEEYENVDATALIRTEVLDQATCDPCMRRYDGMVLPLGSARLDANSPPTGCLGGDRCRGLLLMVVLTEAEAERIREEVGLPRSRDDLRFTGAGNRERGIDE